MPTGGLSNLVRILGAALFLVGWVAWVGYRFAEGGKANDAALFPFFIAAQWVAPSDFQRTVVFRAMLAAAALAWVAVIWRFGTADYHRTMLIWIAVVFVFCIVAWLFDRGYRQWKATQNPTTRLFIATFVLTTAIILGTAAIFYLMSWAVPAFGGGNMGAGWLVALTLNIPLFGLIALGLYLRRTRKLKHDE